MGREMWLKKNQSDTAIGRQDNTSHFDRLDDKTSSTSSRPQFKPQPTRTICDLASQRDWKSALERCHTHPEDMEYNEIRGSLVHFALWSHRKPNYITDESIGANEEEDDFCRFLDFLMSAIPDKMSSVGSLLYSPLHIACSKDSLRNTRIVSMLLKRSVPLEAEDLHVMLDRSPNCVPHFPIEITRCIISFLPNVALMRDSHGKTPLFLACQFSKNIPRRDKHCTDNLKEVVAMLVNYAPQSKAIIDKTGRTPVEVVKKQKKYPELVDILS